MERAQAMTEVDKYELDVLEKVIFPEDYESLVKECIADEFILQDCLKSLTQKKLITPMVTDSKTGKLLKVFIYDSDNIRRYRFQITAKGLEVAGKA